MYSLMCGTKKIAFIQLYTVNDISRGHTRVSIYSGDIHGEDTNHQLNNAW